MIGKMVEEAIIKQINEEIFSSYLYLSMQADLAEKNLTGMSSWMHVQYQEEIAHMLKFFNYLIERNGKVKLTQVETPKQEWKSVLDIFTESLNHEQHITSKINELYDIALAEKDHATVSFLKWFIDEQVEEEANFTDILGKIKMVSNSTEGLFMMDKELGTRVFVDPTQPA